MVFYEAEDAVREDVGADVGVAGGPGAEVERPVGEAVLWDVGIGRGEDGALGGAEDGRRRRVVVGVVVPQGSGGNRAARCGAGGRHSRDAGSHGRGDGP